MQWHPNWFQKLSFLGACSSITMTIESQTEDWKTFLLIMMALLLSGSM